MEKNNTINVFEPWEVEFLQILGINVQDGNLLVRSKIPLVWRRLSGTAACPHEDNINYKFGTGILNTDGIQVIAEFPYEKNSNKTRTVTVEKIDDLGNKDTYTINAETRFVKPSDSIAYLKETQIERKISIRTPENYYAISITPEYGYYSDFRINVYQDNVTKPFRTFPFGMKDFTGTEFASQFDEIVKSYLLDKQVQNVMKAALPLFYKSYTDSLDRGELFRTWLGDNIGGYQRLIRPREELDNYDPLNRCLKNASQSNNSTNQRK